MLEHAFDQVFLCLPRLYDFDSGLRIGTSFPAGWPKGRERAGMPENISLTVARTRRRI